MRHLVTRIELLKPESIFIPWQNDPHPDHRATWQLLTEAVARSENKPRLIEYPIWLWEMGDESDIELIQKMQITGVDIHETLGIKRKALSAHRSQISNLIDDDPEGFTLSKEVLAHFNRKREIFFESRL